MDKGSNGIDAVLFFEQIGFFQNRAVVVQDIFYFRICGADSAEESGKAAMGGAGEFFAAIKMIRRNKYYYAGSCLRKRFDSARDCLRCHQMVRDYNGSYGTCGVCGWCAISFLDAVYHCKVKG